MAKAKKAAAKKTTNKKAAAKKTTNKKAAAKKETVKLTAELKRLQKKAKKIGVDFDGTETEEVLTDMIEMQEIINEEKVEESASGKDEEVKDEESTEAEDKDEDDVFDGMKLKQLKDYIKKNKLEIKATKKTADELRNLIREAEGEVKEEEVEDKKKGKGKKGKGKKGKSSSGSSKKLIDVEKMESVQTFVSGTEKLSKKVEAVLMPKENGYAFKVDGKLAFKFNNVKADGLGQIHFKKNTVKEIKSETKLEVSERSNYAVIKEFDGSNFSKVKKAVKLAITTIINAGK